MFCRQCGKEIAANSKFCNSCGTPVTADTSAPTGPKTKAAAPVAEARGAGSRVERPAAASKSMEKEETKAAPAKSKGNTRGLLCYLGFWVTGIIFLVIEKKDKQIRWHAMQSLVTFGILNIIWGIANTVSWGWVGGMGWGMGMGMLGAGVIAGMVIFIIFFVLWWVWWAILLYKTYHHKVYRVPVFAGLADRCLAALDKDK
ncbi:MAG: zinc-ribbon domain-containing protein [Dehalococcoidales bacterium]|nr:zinc-ribbon domain-containing protein [Dehalococcoidales bacterium]